MWKFGDVGRSSARTKVNTRGNDGPIAIFAHEILDANSQMMENMAADVSSAISSVKDTIKSHQQLASPDTPGPRSMVSPQDHTSHRQSQSRTTSQTRRLPIGQPSTEDSSSEEEASASHGSSHSVPQHQGHSPKLPPFTGKDSWEVWIKRFGDVASLHAWSEEKKLQEILPRLQGIAGEFVYGQLPREKRTHYKRLVVELNHRFRVVETRKTYQAKFSHRVQKANERVEDFAVELKRLYDKAYPRRDRETRREDLLRKFMDGLHDDKVRFHVEFAKDPSSIDDAVSEVINFLETRKRPYHRQQTEGHHVRAVNDAEEYFSYSEAEDTEPKQKISRVPGKDRKKVINMDTTHSQNQPNNHETEATVVEKQKDKYDLLMQKLENIEKQMNERGSNSANQEKPKSDFGPYSGSRSHYKKQNSHHRNFHCFKCGQLGHYANKCGNDQQSGTAQKSGNWQQVGQNN
jgi:hypothetical protein